MEYSEQENSSWSSQLLIHEQASTGEFVGIGGENAHAAPAPTSSDALPPGWKGSQDQNGNQYYYNKELNITQWSRPEFSGGGGGMAGGSGGGGGGGMVGGGGMGGGGRRVGGAVGLDTAAIPMQMPPMPQMIQHVHVPVERFMVVNSHVVDSNIPMQMSPVIQHVHVPVERVRIVEVPKYVDRRVVKVRNVPVVFEKIVEVPQPYERIVRVEVPVERIVWRDVPYQVENDVTKPITREVPVPVEVIREVLRPVEKFVYREVQVPIEMLQYEKTFVGQGIVTGTEYRLSAQVTPGHNALRPRIPNLANPAASTDVWIVTGESLIDSSEFNNELGNWEYKADWLTAKGCILFRFSPRPNERRIVMNAFIDNSWGQEESIPLEINNAEMKTAKWNIIVDDDGFHVMERGKQVHVFAHRSPWSSFDRLVPSISKQSTRIREA